MLTVPLWLGDPMWSALEPGDSQLLWVPMRGVVGSSLTMGFATFGVRSVMAGKHPNGPMEWGALGLQLEMCLGPHTFLPRQVLVMGHLLQFRKHRKKRRRPVQRSRQRRERELKQWRH